MFNLMKMITLTISTPIFPTEDLDKVIQSIHNFFPDIELLHKDDQLFYRTNDEEILKHLYWKQQDQKILDSVRKTLLSSLSDNKVILNIHKQLAHTNYLNVCTDSEPSPLGGIQLLISSTTDEELMKVIDKYFPKYEWIRDS